MEISTESVHKGHIFTCFKVSQYVPPLPFCVWSDRKHAENRTFKFRLKCTKKENSYSNGFILEISVIQNSGIWMRRTLEAKRSGITPYPELRLCERRQGRSNYS